MRGVVRGGAVPENNRTSLEDRLFTCSSLINSTNTLICISPLIPKIIKVDTDIDIDTDIDADADTDTDMDEMGLS